MIIADDGTKNNAIFPADTTENHFAQKGDLQVDLKSQQKIQIS
jgi:hypothetical protein